MKNRLYIDSIRNSLRSILAKDDRVYLLGEDIVEPYGGSFRVTKGLSEDFPGRLLAMPMCEQGYTGFGIGMALGGLKPVVEIMFGDFLTLTIDQLLNHASKFIGLYNSKMAMVVRAPMGGHRGYGATHSQSLERLVFAIPNVNVVAPSIMHDPGSLLETAIMSLGITVFIENKLDYNRQLVPNDKSEGIIDVITTNDEYPIGIARIADVNKPQAVIISYGGATSYALEAQEDLFMNDEIVTTVISPSLISNVNIDLILKEVHLCKNIIISEEGVSDFGWSEHMLTLLYEKGYRGNIGRVGALNEVIFASEIEEQRQLLTKDKIEEKVYELTRH